MTQEQATKSLEQSGTRWQEAKFQGRMLKVARQARGMTQKELADRTGITQAFVSYLEEDERNPSDDQLSSLATTLHFPISFFQQPDIIVGPGVGEIFHRRKKMSAKNLDNFYAWSNIKLMALRRLTEAIDWPEVDLPKLALDVDVDTPEDAAMMLRAKWHVASGPVQSVSEFLDRAGILVVAEQFGHPEMDGMSVWLSELPPIIFVNSEIPQDRLRFTLMHEVGHLVLHQRSALRAVSDAVEEEAHRFASAFLMPADIKPQLRNLTLADLGPLKRKWRVSMSSIVMRARDLGAISELQATDLFRELSRRGWMKREPHQFDVVGEHPGELYNELVDLHLTDLGYRPSDLSDFIHLEIEDTLQRIIPAQQMSGLRLVGP